MISLNIVFLKSHTFKVVLLAENGACDAFYCKNLVIWKQPKWQPIGG